MKKARKPRTPGLLLHKATGQARVILNGKTHYLGAYGTPEAHVGYAELLRRWERNDRRPLVEVPDVTKCRGSSKLS